MNNTRSKASLFLMEIIVSILMFSVASAVCIQVFVKAYEMNRESTLLNQAVMEARTIGELYTGSQSFDTDLQAAYPTVLHSTNRYEIYYNSDFLPCSPYGEDLCYRACLTISNEEVFQNLTFYVEQLSDQKELYRVVVSRLSSPTTENLP